MKINKLVAGVLAGALSLTLSSCAKSGTEAQDAAYPAKDIKMVISYAAGGPTDLAGRAVAKYYEKKFGVSVVVENADGASGSIGTSRVAKAKPDGLTIGVTTSSASSRVPLIQNVGYQLSDLAPIGVLTVGPGILFVPADSTYKTAQEFIDAAKASPETISIGVAGAQAPQSVELERMKEEYGVKFRIVPFAGEAPSVTALLGMNVDAIFGSNSDISLTQVTAGKIRPLAVASQERLKYAPDAPTLAELGFDKLIYGTSLFIMVAPKDTPKEIVSTLETGLKEALKDPETAKAIGEERIPAEFIGADALTTQMTAEQEALSPILKKLFG